MGDVSGAADDGPPPPAGGPVVVATGFLREAKCLAGLPGVRTVVGGGDPDALHARILAAVHGAAGIASFGMAGALGDGLALGDWVVGDRLIGAVELPCDPPWSAALCAALPAARVGGCYADGRMITDPAEKRVLGRAHDAIAVDMESHVAAAIAADHGLPFVTVRCISDAASHALPPAVAVSMRPDGGIAAGAMLASLARRPGQAAEVARTLAGFARAIAVLRRDTRRLGPRLALP